MMPPMNGMDGMNADMTCIHLRISVYIRVENEEGDPLGSPSHNSPELVYFSFWTMALKASASLYAISASALRSRLMLCFFKLLMKTL